jgi:chaperonin GroEL (HSP60 family)
LQNFDHDDVFDKNAIFLTKIAENCDHNIDPQVGDGTNLVIILAGALLKEAEELLRMGLKPTEVADGYELALGKALEILVRFYETFSEKTFTLSIMYMLVNIFMAFWCK